ncbi:glycosyltransferase family 2 protein [Herbiconiux sp. 11R-BC]|uniref:glycosyltransferase family 2 protein n=1 Tax=Herbiconiux sp. 11R-BC TaxID=3111637 RepID=UPI003C019CBE
MAAVVVNWRQPALTSSAVRSLEQQEGLATAGPAGEPVELRIVVVDNGSADGSLEELRSRHPEHLVVDAGRNGGFGAGVNAGIRAAAEWDPVAIVLLNNDAEAEASFVASLVGALLADARTGAVTARILLQGRYRPAGETEAGALVAADGTRWVGVASDARLAGGVELVNSTGNEMTRSGNGRDRDWLAPVGPTASAPVGGRGAGEVLGFSGGAAALRSAALEEVGLFDESLFMYYEDTQLSWRMRRAGWRIRFAPEAVARHAHAASSGTGSETFRFYNERNRVLVAAQHAPARVALTALARTAAATARATLRAGGSAGASADARRRRRSFAAALRGLPAALAERRRVDHAATVPRAAVAAFLVDD